MVVVVLSFRFGFVCFFFGGAGGEDNLFLRFLKSFCLLLFDDVKEKTEQNFLFN